MAKFKFGFRYHRFEFSDFSPRRFISVSKLSKRPQRSTKRDSSKKLVPIQLVSHTTVNGEPLSMFSYSLNETHVWEIFLFEKLLDVATPLQ